MSGLWKVLAIHVVARHAPTGVIELLCDDTLFHKSGRDSPGCGRHRQACGVEVRYIAFFDPVLRQVLKDKLTDGARAQDQCPRIGSSTTDLDRPNGASGRFRHSRAAKRHRGGQLEDSSRWHRDQIGVAAGPVRAQQHPPTAQLLPAGDAVFAGATADQRVRGDGIADAKVGGVRDVRPESLHPSGHLVAEDQWRTAKAVLAQETTELRPPDARVRHTDEDFIGARGWG